MEPSAAGLLLERLTETVCLFFSEGAQEKKPRKGILASALDADVLEEALVGFYFDRHSLPLERLRILVRELEAHSDSCPLSDWSDDYLRLLKEYVEKVSQTPVSEEVKKASEHGSLVGHGKNESKGDDDGEVETFEIDLCEEFDLKRRKIESTVSSIYSRPGHEFPVGNRNTNTSERNSKGNEDAYSFEINMCEAFDSTRHGRSESGLNSIISGFQHEYTSSHWNIDHFKGIVNSQISPQPSGLASCNGVARGDSLEDKVCQKKHNRSRKRKLGSDVEAQIEKHVVASSACTVTVQPEILNKTVALANMLAEIRLSGIDSSSLLQEGASHDESQNQCLRSIIKKIKHLKSHDGQNFEAFCQRLGYEKRYQCCSDEAFLLLCKVTVTKTLTISKCRAFLSQVVRPKIQLLEKTASRLAFSALVHISERHPSPMVEVLLVPLIASSSQSFIPSKVHADLLRRLIQLHHNRPGYSTILERIITVLNRNTEKSRSVELKHNPKQIKECAEARATVVQELLSKPTRYPLLSKSVPSLLFWLAATLEDFPGSLKVANVVLRFLQHHKEQARRYKQNLDILSQKVQSFMRKNIISKLQTL